ncbi:FG-GAP-like repeat-containing protein [Desulfospira joergensenii]|uniref:FG-GAP-like repeat-containing protein n=1 Tax=Desulfospira joergensenii TaxID=53329 RepID=UPI003CC5207E
MQYTGAATVSVPILVPPGRAGIQPKINLVYNSYKKNGWIGMGWDIDMGAIQRSTRHGLDYSADDYVVAMGGNSDLVPRPDWGTDFYGAKIEGGFTKYYFNTSTNGWEATDKSGLRYYFGTTEASRQDDPDDSSRIFKWCLDKVVDTNGNYMTIAYVKDQGQIYLSRIDYTGNQGTSSANLSNSVIFHLEDGRPDQAKMYNINFEVITGKRIKAIEIKTYDRLARAYKFSYIESINSHRSLLEKIQEYGNDVTIETDGNIIGDSDLYSKQLYYFGHELSSFDNINLDMWGAVYQNPKIIAGDYNGDGKTDILYIIERTDGYYDWRLRLSNGSSFDNINLDMWGAVYQNPKIIAGDYNGDGKTDILYIIERTDGYYDWRLRLSNGSSFDNINLDMWGAVYQNPKIIAGDYNGDGKTDILYIIERTDGYYDWRLRLSNGSSFDNINLDMWGAVYQNPKINTGDYNGDGKTDILYIIERTDGYYDWRLRLSNGSSFDNINLDMWGAVYQNPKINTGDYNGDGKTDILYIIERTDGYYDWRLRLSNGSSFDNINLDMWGAVYQNPKINTGDYNGDGKTDILYIIERTDGYYDWRLRLSNGSSFDNINLDMWGAINQNPKINTGDYNGDGKTDILYIIERTDGYYDWRLKLAAPHESPDLLKSINSSFGSTSQFTYKPSSEYNNTLLAYIIHPVETLTIDDGNGVSSTTQYSYAQGFFDLASRDFRGFGNVTQTNPDGTQTITKFHQDEFNKGRQCQVDFKDPSGTLLSRQTLTWETQYLDDPDNTFAFVKLARKRTENYDDETTFVQEDYVHDDANGNLLSTISSGTGAESLTTTLTYENFGDWVWRKTSETLAGSTSGLVRQTGFDYESGTGNLLGRSYSLDGVNDPYISFAYDTYGNLTASTDARGNTTITTYDTETRTYPVFIEYPVTGGVSHIEQTLEIDYRFGKPLLTQDENGNRTSYTYDEFGRLVQTDLPNGGQAVTQYFDDASPRYVISSVKEDDSGNWIDAVTYLDGFNRKIQNVTLGEDGKFITSRIYYDEMGRAYLTEGPFFASDSAYPQTAPTDSPWSQTLFDYRGRPVSIDSPDSVHDTITATFSYSGLSTTITDPDGAGRTETKDYLGRLIRVTEHADDQTDYVTTYQYNAASDLLNVTDHCGNETSMTYDALGRKTGMVDPDMGTWSYTYDANGNLLTQTDAKNQTITFAYDELNRLISKDYDTTDPDVAYTYDNLSIANGRGRLYQTSNGRVTTTIDGYDSLGNVLSETRTLTGAPQTYTTSFTYDLAGKVLTTTTPDAFTVTNTYIPGTGLLESVTGSDGLTYASLSGYTPGGKIGLVEHGNYTYTQYAYDSLSGRLASLLTSRTGPTETMQQRSYSYTPAGDLSGITDSLNAVSYTYTYDGLHRLTSETGSGTPLSYTYDAIGNIASKTAGTGTMTYSHGGTRPHAVDSITLNGTNFDYVYDANGNMTQGPDLSDPLLPGTRTVTYNADNMPVTVTHVRNGTTQAMELTYDGSGARAIKTVQGGGTTYYVNGLFQVKETGTGTETTRFIFAGNLRIAQIQDSVPSFFHKDHLGSSTIMSDAAGTPLESSEYLPYGGLRSHTGTDTSNYKFTDQELDPESGLYNYNARLYDPVIGKFVTADTVVPDPANPQTLNRYSYCYNNPLVYVDPSGHFGFIIGAIIGAVISGVQSDWDPEAMIAGAVIGGISGGVFSGVESAVTSGLAGIAGGPAMSFTTASVISNIAGGAAAGAVAGGLNAHYYGGDIGQGVLKGAFGGAVFGGIGGYYGNSWGWGRVGITTFAGGVVSEVNGGDFMTGAALSGGISLLAYSATTMRSKMIEQSKLDRRNASGISAGHKGDGFKLAGGRFNAKSPSAESYLGGRQGGPGSIFGRSYKPGSFADLLCEAYAGPHDYLNSPIWYNAMGNINTNMSSLSVALGEVMNWANVAVATPFVAADMMPSYLMPSLIDER